MKVLQVLSTLSAGGAEGFVTSLGVSLAQRGVDVRFYLLAGVRGERGEVLLGRLRAAGIEVSGTQERKPASLQNLLRLRALISAWRPDVVQANLFSSEVLCSAVSMASFPRHTHYVRRLAGTDICNYRRPWVVRGIESFFDLTIACSPAVAEAFQRFMNGKAKSNLLTITNGVFIRDGLPQAEDRDRAREALGLSKANFTVAHIGRMLGSVHGSALAAEPKAQDVLLKAFAAAFAGDPDCTLLLVGDGPLRPLAEQLARDLGIAGQVRFLGQQPEPWPALHAADAFCFPSRNEGMPNALVEAASCGLPVVASDIREIGDLQPGEAWLLKPVNDVAAFAAGLRVLRENIEVFRDKARAAAPEFRQRFSMDACAENYMRAYEALPG